MAVSTKAKKPSYIEYVIEADTQMECAEEILKIVRDLPYDYWTNQYHIQQRLGETTHVTSNLTVYLKG